VITEAIGKVNSLEVKKFDVDLTQAYRLLHPKHTILLTCTDKKGKASIITLAWCMPVSADPPMLAISIRPTRHSYKMIEETKEFVINVPTMNIVKETLFCGRRSGKQYDKFKETGLTPLPARMVKPPIIKECIAHLECKLRQQTTAGDHEILVGEILTAYVNREIFDKIYDLNKVKPIYHMGGNDFATLASKIVRPQLKNYN
jgi:flavin reductase (DIM6/NTAB) family NADH-FMN oxidoreductase RutF